MTERTSSRGKSPQQKYPPELRERAVRMVREAIEDSGGVRFGVVTRIARQLGVGAETLRGAASRG
jgi:transposase